MTRLLTMAGPRRQRQIRTSPGTVQVMAAPTWGAPCASLCVLPPLKPELEVLVRSDLVGGHDPELADGGVPRVG